MPLASFSLCMHCLLRVPVCACRQEAKLIAVEREKLAILDENAQLRFKNKVRSTEHVKDKLGSCLRVSFCSFSSPTPHRLTVCLRLLPPCTCCICVVFRVLFSQVLMAMCTISEGDYKALCKEAGIEPRSQKKPAPAPAPLMASPMAGGQEPMRSPAPFAQQQQQAYAPTPLMTAATPMAGQQGPLSTMSQQQQQQLLSTRGPQQPPLSTRSITCKSLDYP